MRPGSSGAMPWGNAWLPVITLLGLQLGALLGGAVVTEVVFDWPGIGSLMIESIQKRDYPVVTGVCLVHQPGLCAGQHIDRYPVWPGGSAYPRWRRQMIRRWLPYLLISLWGVAAFIGPWFNESANLIDLGKDFCNLPPPSGPAGIR